MPGRNKMGPNGQGPMTGRGLGPCGQNQAQGGPGFDMGRGGGGRGWRNRHGLRATGLTFWQRAEMGWPEPSTNTVATQPEQPEVATALAQQVVELETMINDLKERIKQLEGPPVDNSSSMKKDDQ
ncbi:MAG: DUF5320 domain-containing protein [Myxococcota bacterium]|nr:DUF5320 domain-containing protein [Myxococcota bacterium]